MLPPTVPAVVPLILAPLAAFHAWRALAEVYSLLCGIIVALFSSTVTPSLPQYQINPSQVEALAQKASSECEKQLAELQEILEATPDQCASAPDILVAQAEAESAEMPPPKVRRFRSEDVQRGVNEVLLPKLMAHQQKIQDTRKKMRRKELSPREAKEIINASSRVFTERYASAVQVAKQLANEGGVVPLKRLVSSESSWAEAELFASLQGRALAETFRPGSDS
jgi:hypothetical protein